MCRRALLVACVAAAAARKPEAEPSGAERMAVEIDEAGEQSASMPTDRSAEERAAKAGLAKQYSDALVDIMAVLVHGSEASKESAIERLIELAMDSAHGSDQARMFRSAVVAGGALPVLIEEVQAKEDPHRPYLAATALHALAIDDPTTDLDNFHSVEICQHGAVPPLVALLGSEHEQLQSAATGALSQLAENPVCQQMIAAAGALEPLAKMAQFGSDYHKLSALNALEVLSLNNAGAREQLKAQGTESMLDGLASMGSSLLRKEAGAFRDNLKAPLASGAAASEQDHVKQARQTRIRYDNVRRTAIKMMRGWEGRGGGRGGRGAPQDDD
eukprot:Transcript_7070.p1 GENE.Transcript_7070~~Transcript_7070.p1  ORF type:complete len:352 (-),score=140.19 Transcript_7070:123-1112(-)